MKLGVAVVPRGLTEEMISEQYSFPSVGTSSFFQEAHNSKLDNLYWGG